MSVSSNVSSTRFFGSGSTGPFTFGFKFFANSDVLLYRVSTTGVLSLLNEGGDYTLTGAGSDDGGIINLSVALAVGETLVIDRIVDLVQETGFINQGDFYPKLHEDAFDRLTMIVQQLNFALKRSIKLPVDSFDDSVLPVSSRINTVIGFDADGNPTLYPAVMAVLNLPNASAPVAYEVDASGTDMTVNLPASGEVIICKKDASAHIVTIMPSVGGQTIGGLAPSITIDVQGQAVRLLLVGTNWYIN